MRPCRVPLRAGAELVGLLPSCRPNLTPSHCFLGGLDSASGWTIRGVPAQSSLLHLGAENRDEEQDAPFHGNLREPAGFLFFYFHFNFFSISIVYCIIWDVLTLKTIILYLSEISTGWYSLCIYLLNLATLPRAPFPLLGVLVAAGENLLGFSLAGGVRVGGYSEH